MEYSIYNSAMEIWQVGIQYNAPAHQDQLLLQSLATSNIHTQDKPPY